MIPYLTPALLSILYLVWYVVPFAKNIRRARSLGVPILSVPVSPMNVLWIVVEPMVFNILDRLPIDLGNFNYARRGWHFADKASTHEELGDVFVLTSPRETFLHVCDPDSINQIFDRRQDFVRPVELYKMMNVFGRNVATADPVEWKRHRKIVAAPFNENTNKLVWSESLSQARDMLKAWTSHGSKGTIGIARDTRTLSLDVLAATGFKKSYRFRASTEPGPDEARNYREALMITLDNALFMMLVPPRLLLSRFSPKSWSRIGRATTEFKSYMMSMLNEERSLLDAGKPGTGNLMSSLIRASEESTFSDITKGLSVSEILGNIYVINFAGHDTTANTLAYAMLLLAANPAVQEWVAAELHEVLPNDRSDTWEYEALFPRLKRCLAVLYETVRLYPPIMALPKLVNQHSVPLTVGAKILHVDPEIMVVPSVLAVHTHSRYWSPDPLNWRPSRWILPGTAASTDDSTKKLGEEEFFVPRRGTYLPWSDGPQNCPGKKFAHVEFVAVLAQLLQTHRVRLSDSIDSDYEKARAKILAACEDSEHGLLLRMKNADQVRLVWKHA
ncbi:hypothetical protein MMC17_005071 [Xylographa soralifera]|nr:hypothetical protein [Xylographa soralifera]